MKFRKKPIVIEAYRWDGDNVRELTAIGGGRCYLNANLDDVVSELAAALAPLAEPPASGIYPRGHGPKP